jgi:hypothetical protein
MRPFSDTVVICYEQAEALQINQIFGIDANGDWKYHAVQSDNTEYGIGNYVTESASVTYGGAVVMNGKGIYENVSVDDYEYHGIPNTKRVVFTYTAASNSCLHGKEYKIVIILTPDITK